MGGRERRRSPVRHRDRERWVLRAVVAALEEPSTGVGRGSESWA